MKSLPHPQTRRVVGTLLLNDLDICDACVTHVRTAISQLPADVDELDSLIGAGSGPAGEYVNGSRDLPVPIRLGVEALRTAIDSELRFWAEIALGDRYVYHARMSARVHAYAGALARALETLIRLPAVERPMWSAEGRQTFELDEQTGLDGALHLLELHKRVALVSGRTELVHRLTPACPECQRQSLIMKNGSDVAECEHCSKKLPPERYSWIVQSLLEKGDNA